MNNSVEAIIKDYYDNKLSIDDIDNLVINTSKNLPYLYGYWYNKVYVRNDNSINSDGGRKINTRRVFSGDHFQIINVSNVRMRINKNGVLDNTILNNKYPLDKNRTLYDPVLPNQYYPYYELMTKYDKNLANRDILCPILCAEPMITIERNNNVYVQNNYNDIDMKVMCNRFILNKEDSNRNNDHIISRYDMIIIDEEYETPFRTKNTNINVDTINSYLNRNDVNHDNLLMIIALNMLNDECNEIISFTSIRFCTVKLFRPFSINILCPKLFLIVSGYDRNVNGINEEHMLTKKFKSEFNMYKNRYLNTNISKIPKITQMFDTINEIPIKYKHISDIYKDMIVNINTNNNNLIVDNQVLNKTIFEFNTLKRVMDTRVFNDIVLNDYDIKLIGMSSIFDKINRPSLYIKSIVKNNTITNKNMISIAYIKMLEMISVFRLLKFDKNQNVINTFSLCELPGNFVASIINYMSDNYHNKKLVWKAQSLDERDDSTALSDHYGFMKSNERNFTFGDITSSNIIKSYIKKYGGSMDLMTGDGGVGIKNNEFNIQEQKTLNVFAGTMCTIFGCLKNNGKSNAVVKFYLPSTHNMSRSLIRMAVESFNNVYMYKPCTSHNINSEYYLVMKGYNGCNIDHLNTAIDMLGRDNKLSIYDELDNSNEIIDSNINNASIKLMSKVMDALNFNYYYYFNPDKFEELEKTIVSESEKCSRKWVRNILGNDYIKGKNGRKKW